MLVSSELQPHVSHTIRKVFTPRQPFCTHTPIMFSTLSAVINKLHNTFSTLLQEKLWLGDFAQLQANVSVQSIFTVD